MNSIQSRKVQLVAESERQRVELLNDWQTMVGGAHALAVQAKTFGSIGVAAATLVAGVAAFQRTTPAAINRKRTWAGTLFKGARFACAVWLALRRPLR